MEVIVNQDTTKTYPKLMISTKGTVVLFLRRGYGTCVRTLMDGHQLGEYSETWSMELFEDFYGEVVLSN